MKFCPRCPGEVRHVFNGLYLCPKCSAAWQDCAGYQVGKPGVIATLLKEILRLQGLVPGKASEAIPDNLTKNQP